MTNSTGSQLVKCYTCPTNDIPSCKVTYTYKNNTSITCNSLVDSGSDFCIMPKHSVPRECIEPTKHQWVAGVGGRSKVLGKAETWINFGGVKFKTQVTVVDDNIPAIVGRDILLGERVSSFQISRSHVTLYFKNGKSVPISRVKITQSDGIPNCYEVKNITNSLSERCKWIKKETGVMIDIREGDESRVTDIVEMITKYDKMFDEDDQIVISPKRPTLPGGGGLSCGEVKVKVEPIDNSEKPTNETGSAKEGDEENKCEPKKTEEVPVSKSPVQATEDVQLGQGELESSKENVLERSLSDSECVIKPRRKSVLDSTVDDMLFSCPMANSTPHPRVKRKRGRQNLNRYSGPDIYDVTARRSGRSTKPIDRYGDVIDYTKKPG